jgi:Fic family protein
LGRLLITFLLCSKKVLSQPLLYLSIYFKRNRQDYYAHLQKVRTDGDWEGWLAFYLQGIQDVATEETSGIHTLLQMFHQHEEEIKNLGKASPTAIRLFDVLKKQPILSPGAVCKKLKLSFPTVNLAFDRLQKLEIVKEITGRKSYRLFAYDPYIKALTKGMD